MNKVILIGRIVKEPESKSTQSGVKYSRFTLVVNHPFLENQRDFVPMVAWRNQASFIENYLEKGSLISVEGRFTSSSYTNNENQQVTRYEVTAEKIESLESRTQRELRKKGNLNNFKFQSNSSEPPVINFAEENKDEENKIIAKQKKDDSETKSENLTEVPWELDDLK